MANELTPHEKTELAEVLEKNDLGKMMQPLIREIHLFDTYVAGTTHLENDAILSEIREGDRLTLRREENKFDSRAILVLTEEKKKLGYIPEKDNLIFSRLMDAGKMLAGKVNSVQLKGSFTQISIGIYLVDF